MECWAPGSRPSSLPPVVRNSALIVYGAWDRAKAYRAVDTISEAMRKPSPLLSTGFPGQAWWGRSTQSAHLCSVRKPEKLKVPQGEL